MTAEPQRPKRVRIRRCGAKLRVPSETIETSTYKSFGEVVFTCEKEAHTGAELHEDHGIVEMPNGSGREYWIKWQDLGLITFRRRMKVNEK